MDYFEKREMMKKIKVDIEDINEYPDIDAFISSHFQQYCVHGEYDDNSMQLAYEYKMLKSLGEDNDLESKISYILDKYLKKYLKK